MRGVMRMTIRGWLLYTISMLTAHAFSWPSMTAAELKMSDEPRAPGASAIFLDRFISRNYDKDEEVVYERIKILTQEGLQFATIKIPYKKREEDIRDFAARVIKQDGSTQVFDGKLTESVLAESRSMRLLQKSVSLPNVQAGDIIEYQYHRYIRYQADRADYQWTISQPLFTRHARFELKSKFFHSMHMSWPAGLPPGASKPVVGDEMIQMEVHDIPAFEPEEFMPPESQLKYAIIFSHHDSGLSTNSPVDFWGEYAHRIEQVVSTLITHGSFAKIIVGRITNENDTPKLKLQKLYSHVQSLRNLSFDKPSDSVPDYRELKEVNNIEDVEANGYGNAFQLTCLYLALAKAAGLETQLALIATRDRYFFDAGTMNPEQLTGYVIVAKVDGEEIFLDPGNPYAPFGMQPWYESGVMGLRVQGGGARWIKIPVVSAALSTLVREALFKLAIDGTVSGEVKVTYSGLHAMTRRMDVADMDDQAKTATLEAELRESLPEGAIVNLMNTAGWNVHDVPLVAVFKVSIPDAATVTGRRVFMRQGIFGETEKGIFLSASRRYPVYFAYPSTRRDYITLEYPPTCSATSIPRAAQSNLGVAAFDIITEKSGPNLKISRELVIDSILLDTKFHLALHDFFAELRVADADPVAFDCHP